MRELLERLTKEAQGVPPLDAEEFYERAYAHYQAGRHADAIELFRLLAGRYPLEPRFWCGLGASAQESGDYQAALFAWAMSALLEPKSPLAHFHAAQCAYSLGQKEDALLALGEAKARLAENDPLKEPVATLEECWRTP